MRTDHLPAGHPAKQSRGLPKAPRDQPRLLCSLEAVAVTESLLASVYTAGSSSGYAMLPPFSCHPSTLAVVVDSWAGSCRLVPAPLIWQFSVSGSLGPRDLIRASPPTVAWGPAPAITQSQWHVTLGLMTSLVTGFNMNPGTSLPGMSVTLKATPKQRNRWPALSPGSRSWLHGQLILQQQYLLLLRMCSAAVWPSHNNGRGHCTPHHSLHLTLRDSLHNDLWSMLRLEQAIGWRSNWSV